MEWSTGRFRWRSVVLTWLFSYMIVLFVPIAINLAVYWQTEKIVEHQIKRGNDALLQQMKEAMDNEVYTVKRLISQIYGNVKVQNLFYSNKFSRGEYRYDLYEIIQDLKVFRSAYTEQDEFYLYWSSGDRVIMPNVYRDSREAYEDLHGGGNLTYEEWRNKVDSINQRHFFLTSRQSEAGVMQEYATYISSFPADSMDQPVGSVVVMINKERLLKIIGNMRQFIAGDVFILNKNNEVLASNTAGISNLDQIPPFAEGQGSRSIEYNGETAHLYYNKSANSDLTYVTIVPSGVLWKEAQHVRKLTYFGIAFSLVGGIVLTYVFLRRNYQPLGKLVRTFSNRLEDTATGRSPGTNEFHFLERVLSKALDDHDQVHIRMQQQQNQLRGNFISRLLKGRVETTLPLAETMEAFQLRFTTDYFAVMLLYVEDNEAFFRRIAGMQVQDRLRLLEFIVTNVAEELVRSKQQGWITEVDGMMACLINAQGESLEQALSDLKQAAAEAQTFLKSHFEIEIQVTVSNIHTSAAAVPEAYKEAMDTLEHKLIMGRKEIMAYEELQREQEQMTYSGYYYPLHVEQQLMNYVKVGERDKALSTLTNVIERNRSGSGLSAELTRCLMLDLAATLIKTIHEITDSKESQTLPLNQLAIDRLVGIKTVKEMQEEMLTMLEEVCSLTAARQEEIKQRQKQEEKGEFVQSIIRYIEQHYQNVNLNVSMMGDAFDMKPTYLSKLFRDHTGEGLLDYINKVRVTKAKLLLKQEKMTLQEAAGLCGFSDMNTFIRSFKKWEGVTPGQYRRME